MQYQHKVIYSDLTHRGTAAEAEELNEFGDKGWRLVAVVPDAGSFVRYYLVRENP